MPNSKDAQLKRCPTQKMPDSKDAQLKSCLTSHYDLHNYWKFGSVLVLLEVIETFLENPIPRKNVEVHRKASAFYSSLIPA